VQRNLAAARQGQHVRAEQRERDAHGAQEQVLPGGLQRPVVAVEVDERGRGQGGGLHADPQQAQVRRHAHKAHACQKKQEAAGEARLGRVGEQPALDHVRPLAAHLAVQIARGVEGCGQEQHAGDEQEQFARGVQQECAVEHGARAAHEGGQGEQQMRHGHADQKRAPGVVPRHEEGRRPGTGREQDDQRVQHPRYSLSDASRSASMWSNSRLMRKMAMPMTKTATNTSSRMPISTSNWAFLRATAPKAKMPFSSTR